MQTNRPDSDTRSRLLSPGRPETFPFYPEVPAFMTSEDPDLGLVRGIDRCCHHNSHHNI